MSFIKNRVPSTALVVGAGIGGLAAGIALQRTGWHVRIFERAASPRELGFALNLAPNAMVALRELGVADRVLAAGSLVAIVEVRDGEGKLLKRLDVGDVFGGAQSVVALRPALHSVLLNAVPPDSLLLGCEVVDFEAASPGVELRLKDGRSASGDLLVGADGIGSVIRRRLHPDEGGPRQSGYYGIRGVAYGAAPHLGSRSAIVYLGDGIEAAVVQAGQDAVYWYISLRAEAVPSATEAPHLIAGRAARVSDETFRAVISATRAEDTRLDELVDRDPVREWGQGPITLLGDAAHPMLPHTGQGAAQALEDAVALSLALHSTGDIPSALRRYEHVRFLRTRRIVKSGRWIPRVTTTRSRVVRVLRAAAIRAAPVKALGAAFALAGGSDPHRALRVRSAHQEADSPRRMS